MQFWELPIVSVSTDVPLQPSEHSGWIMTPEKHCSWNLKLYVKGWGFFFAEWNLWCLYRTLFQFYVRYLHSLLQHEILWDKTAKVLSNNAFNFCFEVLNCYLGKSVHDQAIHGYLCTYCFSLFHTNTFKMILVVLVLTYRVMRRCWIYECPAQIFDIPYLVCRSTMSVAMHLSQMNGRL